MSLSRAQLNLIESALGWVPPGGIIACVVIFPETGKIAVHMAAPTLHGHYPIVPGFPPEFVHTSLDQAACALLHRDAVKQDQSGREAEGPPPLRQAADDFESAITALTPGPPR